MDKIYGGRRATLLAAALLFLSVSSAEASSPKAAVEILNAGILKSNSDPTALLDALNDAFDLNYIALLSVGRQRWKGWDIAQRKHYTNTFTAYIVAIYQHRFRDYGGSGLKIYKVQMKDNRALVFARIGIVVDEQTLADNKPININFLLSQDKKNERWLIKDVYFKGTISEVAGFRAQFSKILEEDGYTGLIMQMRAKCEALGKYCTAPKSTWK